MITVTYKTTKSRVRVTKKNKQKNNIHNSFLIKI